MTGNEVITRMLDLINDHGDLECISADDFFGPDEETGLFEDIPQIESIEYTELPVEGGVLPCFLIKSC